MCLLICFFFFKQKTAYERRISDWSSDVCSSDLVPPRSAMPATGRLPGPGSSSWNRVRLSPAPGPTSGCPSHRTKLRCWLPSLRRARDRPTSCKQIGSASCRERVLPSQLSTLFALSLQQQSFSSCLSKPTQLHTL